ncbi:MAG: hypothetical protein JWQ19_185 [Subtercola sp.]|nr:hypothetical protein [Subtercola sp.]
MMLWLAMSIRLRVAVGTTLVACLLLVVIGLAVHASVAAITTRSEESLAASDLAPYVADLRANPHGSPDQPAPGVLVLVEDPLGVPRITSVTPEVQNAVQEAPQGDGTFSIAPGESTYMVVSETVQTDSGLWRLWAVRNGAANSLTIAGIDQLMVAVLTLALLVIGTCAWLLATLALRPVGRMRRSAELLGARGEGELPRGRANDELSALAVTLNSFLHRVRDTSDRERAMISAASHEIRTPIAVIATQLELMHRGFGNADALEAEIIATEATVTRLNSLASNLLELSRLDATMHLDHSIPHESATADELLTELMFAVDRARTLAPRQRTAVEFSVDVQVPGARYWLSSCSFGRILDNLISNSLRSTETGGQISIHFGQTPEQLELTVEDSGTGIPEEFLPRIFDRFSQAEEVQSSTRPGSGLGLALVAATVDRGHGTITLSNRQPAGVTARVSLDLLP